MSMVVATRSCQVHGMSARSRSIAPWALSPTARPYQATTISSQHHRNRQALLAQPQRQAASGLAYSSWPWASASRTSWATWTNSGESRMSSVRSSGSGDSMTLTMRPGRGDITTMRLDR